MAVDFKKSKTRENLMRAFAGESQARNRYTIASETAKNQRMFAISQIFLFTAEQERAHAERFYDLLKNLSGTTIEIDESYPVDHCDDVIKLLKAARHNEMEEFEDVYPVFAETAKEEEFLEASGAFRLTAQVEEIHGKRFGKVAELLEKGKYYEGETEQEYMCLNCGHIHCGKFVPEICPLCHHNKGYFIPVSLAPYLECGFLK